MARIKVMHVARHALDRVVKCANKVLRTLLTPLWHQATAFLIAPFAKVVISVLYRRQQLDTLSAEELLKLCDHYKAPCTDQRTHNRQILRDHIDVVPVSLIIAQAANESAWGTSRFAKDANNYFGEWCYQKGCGLVPKRRQKGAKNLVRAFDNPVESVASYVHNLNTSHAYDQFRELRANDRRQNRYSSGLRLAEGLTRYSARGEDYVKEIRAIIRFNELAQLDLPDPENTLGETDNAN
jgi:Bax protein